MWAYRIISLLVISAVTQRLRNQTSMSCRIVINIQAEKINVPRHSREGLAMYPGSVLLSPFTSMHECTTAALQRYLAMSGSVRQPRRHRASYLLYIDVRLIDGLHQSRVCWNRKSPAPMLCPRFIEADWSRVSRSFRLRLCPPLQSSHARVLVLLFFFLGMRVRVNAMKARSAVTSPISPLPLSALSTFFQP